MGGGLIRGQTAPIRVAGMPVEIAVAPVTAVTVRITVAAVAGAAGVPEDGALVRAAEARALARSRTADSFDPVAAGNLRVRFTADPPTIHVEGRGGQPVQRLTLDAQNPGASFLLPKGPLLGLGEGGPQFDRKGSTDRMRNGQGGYQLRTHGGRVPIQWLVGTDGWGMYIHHPLGSFDLTGAEGTLSPFADALPLDVFVTASDDPAVIMGEYARLTGHAQLPPLWSFGYMQSHRTLSGPEEVKWVARTFREKRLPCDALIYLGTEFTPSGWNTRNGEFAWKKENFPEPRQMIDEMHAQHFKVVLHIVIEGRRMSGAVADACTPDKAVPSGRTPTIGGRRIARCRATGRITSPSTISASMGSGPIKVTGSMRPRAWRASGCIGRGRSAGAPTNGPSRSIATGTWACSGTARSSGQAMCIRRGRR